MAPNPAWYEWAFWARDSESLRNLSLVIAAVFALPLLWWRTLAANRSAKAADAQAQTNAGRHLAETFTRAIDQLGDDKMEVRLGAIYALERIARESEEYHWPIMEPT